MGSRMYASRGTITLSFSEHLTGYQALYKVLFILISFDYQYRNSQYNNIVFTPYAVETETKKPEIQYGPLQGVY